MKMESEKYVLKSGNFYFSVIPDEFSEGLLSSNKQDACVLDYDKAEEKACLIRGFGVECAAVPLGYVAEDEPVEMTVNNN